MTLILPFFTSYLLKLSSNNMLILLCFSLSLIMLNFMEKTEFIIFNSFFMSDKLSFTMTSLSIFSLFLIIISSMNWTSLKMNLTLILFFLLIAFNSSSMLMFYIFFEVVLIPTMFLISMKGSAPERLQAGMYMFIYTIMGSLPLLLGILLNNNNDSFISNMVLSKTFYFPILFILAFLVKLPMFFFHIWLPKAHVEAPMEGSMILAAILLKLGGFGLIRFSLFLSSMSKFLNYSLISLGLSSMFFTSINCIRQKDLKALIAYSSVAHMALMLSSIFSNKILGEKGAILMMISHGISSSALFFLATVFYKNLHSRNLLLFKSLIIMFPSVTIWWFLFSFFNFSVPPSVGMISEILMFSSLIQFNKLIIFSIFMASLSTATFSIIMFSNPSHNSSIISVYKLNLSTKEFLSLSIHFLPLSLLFLKSELFM